MVRGTPFGCRSGYGEGPDVVVHDPAVGKTPIRYSVAEETANGKDTASVDVDAVDEVHDEWTSARMTRG